MAKNEAYRKYLLTFNNPQDHNYGHERIKAILEEFSSCLYWCMRDEIGGEEHTYHTHLYVAFKNAVEFQRIHRCFYGAHIDPARGSHQENRDYIRKEGKWADSEKAETGLPETFEEFGELPPEDSKRKKQSEAVLNMLDAGASNAEIIRAYPSEINHLPRLDQARQALLEERYSEENRMLDVEYIWGKAGAGKTSYVLGLHGAKNVYRVTNYKHPFDGYRGQPVILFEEFRDSIPYSEMLSYLDIYPVQLPCRYANKWACYTKVYIVSNVPLERQYLDIQYDVADSIEAFRRRIHRVWEMLPGGIPAPFEGVGKC